MSSVEDWIERKLDEGADRDALKQVLREKGHDPDKVNRVAEDKKPSSESSELDISEEKEDELDQEGLQNGESTSEQTSLNLRKLAGLLVLFVVSLTVGLFVSGTI